MEVYPQLLFLIIIIIIIKLTYKDEKAIFGNTSGVSIFCGKAIGCGIDFYGYINIINAKFLKGGPHRNRRKHISRLRLLCHPASTFFPIQTDTASSTFLYLASYCLLFFIYSLKTYAAFHFPPTQPNIHATNFDLNLIFTFKLTQERRRELELALREDKGI
jgi:hypothetical protein